MEKLWFKFKKILIKYPAYFPFKSLIDLRRDFYWAYEAVMTRCFGWSLPSTSLVPFADMLNHSNEATTYYLVNKKFERNPELIEKNE